MELTSHDWFYAILSEAKNTHCMLYSATLILHNSIFIKVIRVKIFPSLCFTSPHSRFDKEMHNIFRARFSIFQLFFFLISWQNNQQCNSVFKYCFQFSTTSCVNFFINITSFSSSGDHKQKAKLYIIIY